MRWDMNEVLVETGRSQGSGDKGEKKFWQQVAANEYEDAPKFESTSRHRKPGGGKSLGDKLSPLYNFLFARAGQKWDDVYREICAVNDKRTILGWHLFSHLDHMVDFEGTIYRRWHYRDLYVGFDGILHRGGDRKSWRAKQRENYFKLPVKQVRLNSMSYYEVDDGIWYRYDGRVERISIPSLIRHDGTVRPEHKEERLVWDKKQVGKKELKLIREMVARNEGVLRKAA